MYKLIPFLRLLFVSILVVLPLNPLHSDEDDDDEDFDDRFVANEVVVKLDPASGATIEEIHADYGTVTLSTVLESAAIYLIKVADGVDPEIFSEQFEEDPRLLYAEPNYVTSVPQSDGHVIWAWSGGVPQLGIYPDEIIGQPSMQSLELPAVQDISTGQGVIVAILDTGLDLEHPNLVSSIIDTGYDFVEDDADPGDRRMGLDADADGIIDENFGHGTHVAGVVLLAAPEARILPMRVLDSEGRGNVFTLVEAINRAVEGGADIINLSLGTDFYSDLLEETIEEAIEANVLVVAAAGNANSDLPRYPAADDDVLGVASVDDNDLKSAFTNWGPWVSVSAPGEALISAFPENAYSAWSGTSMAAPLVAGQAAVLKALSPNIRQQSLRRIITSTAANINALNPAWVDQLGAGRIDLLASANAILKGVDGSDLNSAIDRLNQGLEKTDVYVEGIAAERIEEETYRFTVGDMDILLKLWDDAAALVIGSSIRVSGELEFGDEDDQEDGFFYELEAQSIEYVDESGGGSNGGDEVLDGTLSELVRAFESGTAEDLSVRVIGTLGAPANGVLDDDDDYLFSDGSGVTVVLDLDSRAQIDFVLAEGIQLQITGELALLDEDEQISGGPVYELEALLVSLPDGTSFDVGQSSPLTEATVSDWIGYFWRMEAPGWYYHPSKGFLFGGDVLGDDDWFFSSNLTDWIYSGRSLYPFVFSNANGWHYLLGSPYDATQSAYSYSRDQWISDFWH